MRVAPAAEEFVALLPAMPEETAESLQIAGTTVVVRHYGVAADGVRYAILSAGVKDFPGEEVAYVTMLHLCDKLFSSSAPGEAQGSGAAVQTELRRELRLNGYTGREYAIRVRMSSGLLRFYKTGRHYYAAVSVTAGGSTPQIQRFMDSFKLVAPAPVAARRRPARPTASAKRQVGPHRPATGATWLVILRSYSVSERAAANRDLDRLRRAGFEARIVRTEDYPNLRKGLLAMVMGPYPRGVAQEVHAKVRASAKGAYIKSGW